MPRHDNYARTALTACMLRAYVRNVRLGGSDRNSRVVAALEGVDRYGVSRVACPAILNHVLQIQENDHGTVQ